MIYKDIKLVITVDKAEGNLRVKRRIRLVKRLTKTFALGLVVIMCYYTTTLNFYFSDHKAYKHIFCMELLSTINVFEIATCLYVDRTIYDSTRNLVNKITSPSSYLVEMQRLFATMHL